MRIPRQCHRIHRICPLRKTLKSELIRGHACLPQMICDEDQILKSPWQGRAVCSLFFASALPLTPVQLATHVFTVDDTVSGLCMNGYVASAVSFSWWDFLSEIAEKTNYSTVA